MRLESRKSGRPAWAHRMLAPALAVFLSWTGTAFGESPSPAVLQASDVLYIHNPVTNVALLANGFVAWPTHGDDLVVDIGLSRQAQEKLLLAVKRQLESKGYRVGAAVPAGVAFVDPVFDYEHLKYLAPDKQELSPLGVVPLYLYPTVAGNWALSRAVRDLIEPMNMARADKALERFRPNPESAKFIARALDPTADTVCSVQLAGIKYSNANAFGTAMRANGLVGVIVAGATGAMSDEQRMEMTCFSAKDGTLLWQNSSHAQRVDPGNPTDQAATTLLQYLPGRGYRMSDRVQRAFGGPPPTTKTGP
jgi:hypothetical protein